MSESADLRAAPYATGAAGRDAAAASATRSWERLVGRILLLVPALWCLGHLFPPLNHDAALILDMAGRWVGGQRLYVDIIDVNPPLIFVLSAIPAGLAWATGLPDTLLFTLFVQAWILASALLSRHLLPLLRPGPLAQALWLPLALYALVVYPGAMFGQREHLMLIAALPYLMLAAIRLGGGAGAGRLGLLAALLAGFGFALKPYFLIGPALVEGYLLLVCRERLSHPARIALLAGPAVHLLIVLFATPAYLAEAVPLALAYYVEPGQAMWSFLGERIILPSVLLWLVFGTGIFLMRAAPLLQVTALAAAGGILAAAIQAKGWDYQSLPANVLTLVMAVLACAAMIDRYLAPGARREAGIIAAAAMALLYYHSLALALPFRNQLHYAGSPADRLARIMQAEAYDDRVMLLSPGVYPHFPAVNYAGVELVMPFESMWLLQGIYAECGTGEARYHRPDGMPAPERRLYDAIAHELADLRPSLLIVDRIAGIPACRGLEFDYLDYFGRHPRFAAALERYAPIMAFDRYTIYRRVLD